jgi:hypothetical protein
MHEPFRERNRRGSGDHVFLTFFPETELYLRPQRPDIVGIRAEEQ